MMTQMIERLTGDALLAKVKELGDVEKAELVFECGYFFPLKEGEQAYFTKDNYRLDFTGFYEALLEAKGLRIDGEWTDKVPQPEKRWLNGKTETELQDWCKLNRPNYGEFETYANAMLMHKYFTVNQLQDLVVVCWKQWQDALKEDNHDLAELWKNKMDSFGDVVKRLKAVDFGEADPAFEAYEEDNVTNDPYLSQISADSLEVLKHFGGEAPNLLNTYSCALEDALLDQVGKVTELSKRIQELTGETPYPDNAASIKESVQLLKNDMRQAN